MGGFGDVSGDIGSEENSILVVGSLTYMNYKFNYPLLGGLKPIVRNAFQMG